MGPKGFLNFAGKYERMNAHRSSFAALRLDGLTTGGNGPNSRAARFFSRLTRRDRSLFLLM